MTYQEFKDKLILFGYVYTAKPLTSVICNEHIIRTGQIFDKQFINWKFRDVRNGETFESTVDYIIDEYGIIRQQFDDTPNIVRFHIYNPKTRLGFAASSGYWTYHTFEKCIEEIGKSEFVNIDVLRNYKLQQIGL